MSGFRFLRRDRRPALVLSDPAASRSLLAIVAILTFLAALAAAGAEMVAASSREWRAALAREATIQLRPQAGRDIEADLARAASLARAAAGVAEARILSRADAEALLEPWLGRGLDLASLPVPRLVSLRLSADPAPDLRALERRLAAEIPGAGLDDHGAWRARLSGVANTILGAAAALMLVILAASGLAVAFATRGAMAGSRDAVDVLQLVGATDRFVARVLALRFLALAAAAAAAGAAAAALSLPLLGWIAALASGARGSEDGVLFGTVSVGLRAYLLILCVAAAVAAIAGLVSAATAKRFLRELRAG
ncbi:cell division protein FtsX [Enterovirga aerilata]|uniref:ABC transporter permease n=1 Tax=Enterovirga aerilata TaxID=2730920 RepID=A0A849I5I5_9HYPH|nr:ABC transporter permease [Enterovirga sp. DB1703]NNM71360.1 ABC transporter permease [Enterovirga sp. DB1703]